MDRDRKHDRAKQSHDAPLDGAGVVNPRARQRAFCIAALPHNGGDDLAELKELLRTTGVAVSGEMIQRRPTPDANNYLGKGKLAELKRAAQAADANLIVVDDELLPRQERNLEEEVGMPVIDRTAIILDIFADHASSAEGKLQVELAQLQYNLARMRGLWTHLERLGGGIGTRGPGESQIETDRRLARDRIAALKRRLRRADQARRESRRVRERSHQPRIALAGYTNAGKSTLMNSLTEAGLSSDDRLFETLDPTTRSFRHEGRDYLLTDTVGFIRKLPHQLVESFKATLDETANADLILHVVDASASERDRETMAAAVDEVLEEIGANRAPSLLVMNKVDLLDEDQRRWLAPTGRDAEPVSARTGEGLDSLRDRIERAFRADLTKIELLVPFERGDVLSELHEIAGDLERKDTPEGVMVRAMVPQTIAERMRPYEASQNARGQVA